MVSNEKERTTATSGEPAPNCESERKDNTTKALERLLAGDHVAEERPAAQNRAELSGMVAELNGRIDSVATSVTECLTKLEELAPEIQRLRTDDRVLSHISSKYQQLSEQHHEREFLYPVFNGLIAVADRCLQQTDRLRGILGDHSAEANRTIVEAIQLLLDARDADRVEVESLLANHGVQRFEHPEEMFDATVQKCIHREECDDASLNGRVAQRLLPGYRRYGKVLRHECVSVYVHSPAKTTSQ